MFDLRNIVSWRVTYAERSRAGDCQKFLDGFLSVRRDSRKLLLLNSAEQIVDSRWIGDKEDIPIGGTVDLPRHRAWIPLCSLSPDSLVGKDWASVETPSSSLVIGSRFGSEDSSRLALSGGDQAFGGAPSADSGPLRAVVSESIPEWVGDRFTLGGASSIAGGWCPAIDAAKMGSQSGADKLQSVALFMQSASATSNPAGGTIAAMVEGLN